MAKAIWIAATREMAIGLPAPPSHARRARRDLVARARSSQPRSPVDHVPPCPDTATMATSPDLGALLATLLARA